VGRTGGGAGAAGHGGVWGCGRGSEPAGDAAGEARGDVLWRQGARADRGDGGGASVVEVAVGVGVLLAVVFFFFFFPSNIVEGFSSGSFLFLGFGLSFRWCHGDCYFVWVCSAVLALCWLYSVEFVIRLDGVFFARSLLPFCFISYHFLFFNTFSIFLFPSIPLFILPLLSPPSRSRNLNPRSKKEKIHLSSMLHIFSACVHSHNNEILEVVWKLRLRLSSQQ
jgi:hypothetical protein